MARGDWAVGGQSLTLPPGAAPGAPQIVIGPDIPPELQAFYAGFLVAVVLWRQSATRYTYMGVTANTFVTGTVEAGVVGELFQMIGNGAGRTIIDYGSFSPNDIQFGGTTSTLAFSNQFTSVSTGTDWRIDGFSQPRGFRQGNITDNGTVVTTPAGGAETAVPSVQWDQEPTFDFTNGRIYCAVVLGNTIEAGGAGAVGLVRLRKGTATVVGTQLGLWEAFCPAGFGGLTQSFAAMMLFKNTSGGLVSSKLSLTINGPFGATWSLNGVSTAPLTAIVFDVGATSEQNWAAQLVSV